MSWMKDSLLCRLKKISDVSKHKIFFLTLGYINLHRVLSSCSIPRWEDESLGQSGLSDTTEMLDELVREGYLSASDLDFTDLRATQHSRYGVHYNSEHFTT